MKLTFKDIFMEYLFILRGIKSKLKHNEITEKESSDLLYENMEWFHYLRHYAFEYGEVYDEIKNKKTTHKKKFLLPEEKRCPGCDDGFPYKVIKYRGFEIPVYDDDYGQQDFAMVLGEEISGGSYNFLSSEEFADALDRKLEKLYLEDKYDIEKEYKSRG